MLGLDDLEIGRIVRAGTDLAQDLRLAKKLEIRTGHIAFPGELKIQGSAEIDAALTQQQFIAAAAIVWFKGEDDASVLLTAKTAGLFPSATRAERIARVKEVSEVARELAIDTLICAVGVFPPDINQPAYEVAQDTLLELSRFCHRNGQSLAIEAGTEPPKVLLRLIEDVHHPSLRINFNPGKMIRYGTGNPVEALDVFGKHVIAVSCSDGDWPLMERPDELGERRTVGEGKVEWAAVVPKLKAIAYRGPLTIQANEEQQIKKAAGFLRELTRKPAAKAEEARTTG